MDVKELKRLMDAMAAAGVVEVEYEWDGNETTPGGRVALRRGLPAGAVPSVAPSYVASLPAPSFEAVPAGAVAAAVAPAAAAATAAPPATKPAGVEVVAPIVGTFYSAASPDAPDLVRLGDRVKVGQVLCIIEAMKLMNEIEAEVAGTVVEILVRNEDPVEYGQALFRIAPG
jgi:acetyl-CoA carboxylase biotin carboxyl carrier protein